MKTIRLWIATMLLIGYVLVIAPLPPARAASFDLTGDCPGGVGDVAALITALNTANGNGEADTITLAASCVYTLDTVDNSIDGSNGLPVITSAITIEGNGATIQRDNTTPAPDFRILQVGGTGNLTLSNLTVQYGVADYGAGIYNNGGILELNYATVRDNTVAGFGGGIENLGTLSADHCTVSGNSSGGSAAGIYNEGPMTLTNSTISDNTATRDSAGITNYVDATITNCTISNNDAQGTGGDGRGGGIGIWGGNLQITNSTFSGNNGEMAGAIYYMSEGGGGSSLVLTNVTLVGNSSGINLEGGSGAEVRYQNSIIAGNTAFDCYLAMEGAFTSMGYNLLGSAGGCPSGGTGDQTTANAQLAALADNGGPTWTHALLAASPAYNAIPAASCVVAADQRGVTRPQGTNNCDVGAFEAQPPTAIDDSATTAFNTAVPIDVPANDTDDTALDLTAVTVTGGPSSGSVSVDPTTGVVTYTPNTGFSGSDSFTYTILDEHGFVSNVATVTVTVNQAPNVPPTAVDDVAETDQGVAVTVDVLANDSDTDGALVPGSVTVVGAPAHGTAVANADGTITYTPGAGFVGVDTFTYTVQDNALDTSNVATVTVTVNQINAPVEIPEPTTLVLIGLGLAGLAGYSLRKRK